jgi:hypothetical protein
MTNTERMNELIKSLVEITIKDPDDFLKVRETLSRIGISSKLEKTLTQSCHILHKQGKYYLVHFKELFLLDGKYSDFSLDDVARRNTICNLLREWNLITIVNPDKTKDPTAPLSQIKILSHKEKQDWNLVSKYSIGKIKKRV